MQNISNQMSLRRGKTERICAGGGENCFLQLRFPQPRCALGCGGQKIHKEWRRDISDTAAAGVTAPWLGRPPPLLAKYEARKRGEKRLMQVIQEAQGRGGSMRSHSVLRERKQGRILSSKAQIVPKLAVK